jgi:hypothetical protein
MVNWGNFMLYTMKNGGFFGLKIIKLPLLFINWGGDASKTWGNWNESRILVTKKNGPTTWERFSHKAHIHFSSYLSDLN